MADIDVRAVWMALLYPRHENFGPVIGYGWHYGKHGEMCIKGTSASVEGKEK
jgi:hypothetical protein